MSHAGCYAVLSGDIIKSRSLNDEELEAVRAGLVKAAGEVSRWQTGLIKGRIDFFRGDAWQLLLTRPTKALRVAVFLRASLLAQGKADSRISIGLGTVDTIALRRVSLSRGAAFSLSGRGLDRMKRHRRLTIELPESAGVLADWLPVVGHLCDSLMGQWTQRQAQMVCLAARPGEPTQAEIAKRLEQPVARQAVTKALDGAKWHAVCSAIHQFEATNWTPLLAGKNGGG